MSVLDDTGLSLQWSAPLWAPLQGASGALTDQVSAYSHTSQAVGGFWQAGFTLTGELDDLESWFQDGLGRHVWSEGQGQVAFEGFVNRITLSAGNGGHARGPLTEVVNRNALWYSPVDTSVLPPVVGDATLYGTADDADSQARYGLWERVTDLGAVTTAEAAQYQAMVLAQLAEPPGDQSGGSTSAPVLQVECLGYVHLLAAYVYQQLLLTGTENASAQVALALAADPNGLLTETNGVEENTFQVPRYVGDNPTAWDLLQKLVTYGDATFRRWLFGVWEGRRPVYAAAPSTVSYEQALHDPAQTIYTARGSAPVPGALVRAGRWLMHPDFLIGRVQEGTPLERDPRAVFLESVTWAAPGPPTWTGGRNRNLDQVVAQLGLGRTGSV